VFLARNGREIVELEVGLLTLRIDEGLTRGGIRQKGILAPVAVDEECGLTLCEDGGGFAIGYLDGVSSDDAILVHCLNELQRIYEFLVGEFDLAGQCLVDPVIAQHAADDGGEKT